MKPRLAALLAAIPFAPTYASARTIERKLREQGFAITRRSVQRELVVLARFMPLRVDARARPYRWSWVACPCGRTCAA